MHLLLLAREDSELASILSHFFLLTLAKGHSTINIFDTLFVFQNCFFHHEHLRSLKYKRLLWDLKGRKFCEVVRLLSKILRSDLPEVSYSLSAEVVGGVLELADDAHVGILECGEEVALRVDSAVSAPFHMSC